MDLSPFTKDWGSCVQKIEGSDGAGVPTLGCIWVVLSNVINAALVLSGVVAIFLIIWAGFQYVTSSGDKEKVDAARKRLTYAIIGLIFIFMSFFIINFIATFTGVDINQISAPPGGTPNTP